MKITNKELIQDLIQRTHDYLNQAERYLQMSEEELNWKENPEKWSVLECIEHLNRYGDFYIPEIRQRIKRGKQASELTTFKSGWLGNYFAESMLPNEQMYKMKTFKSMNPVGSNLDKSVLNKFINQQKELLELLDTAIIIDMTKTKTGTSISKLIKLRLGDTFRVVIYHNYRHILQANNVLEKMKYQKIATS